MLTTPDVDEVNIIISRSDRAEHTGEERLSVTPEMSLDIWNQYIVNEPKITAAVTSEASPIRAAYEEINKMPPGSTVMFVVGEKDSDLGDTRYAAIPEYAAQRGIKYATNPVTPEQTGVAKDLSATEMRRNVLSRNKGGFFAQLPRHLGPDQKESIFNLLQRGIQKKINESISSLADIRRLVEEVINEVESEKQRRWACAQLGDDFKGEKELTKAQAKEFCAAEVEEGAVGSIPMGDIEGYGAPLGVVGSERRKKKDEEDDELEEGLGDFFKGEAAAEEAMDQVWLLKIASERDKYLKLSAADRSDVARLLAVTPERLNQLATSQGKMYYAPIDAGVEPWILVRQKMAQIQKKLFDTEKPLPFSDASELEELSSMGGGSVQGYAGPGKRDGKKKKKDSIIREDDEQYVKEVLDYILTRGTVNANRS